MTTQTAYKGADKNLCCQGFQYEVGKEYEHTGELQLCPNQEDLKKGKGGFHACKNPLDALDYYDLCDSRWCEVEQGGKMDSDEKKTVSSKIKIKAEIKLPGLIKAAIEFLFSKNKPASGDYSQLAASGDSSKLAASGDYSKLAASGHYSQLAASGDYSKLAASGHYSQLAASGDYSKLAASGDYSKLATSGDYSKLAASGHYSKVSVEGKESIACGIGISNRVKAHKDGWIVLVDWQHNKINNIYHAKVGRKIKGVRIRPNTWYWFEDGKLQNKQGEQE